MRTATLLGLVLVVMSHVPCLGYTLVDKGEAQTDIMISKDAFPPVILAARELQYCISQMTGCTLPIVQSTHEFSGLRIVHTGSALSPSSLSLTPTSLALKRYQYVIQFTEGEIILLGHDARDSTGTEIDYRAATEQKGDADVIQIPGMFDDQGTLKAAYHFLESDCGVRFFGPRNDAVHFPQCASLIVNPKNVRHEPSIKHASGSLTWDWPIMKAQYGNPSGASKALFGRRLRLGGIPWYTNHHETEAWAWEALGTEARMSQLKALIMEAEAIAETASPTVRVRVARWKHGVWEYMETGRHAYFIPAPRPFLIAQGTAKAEFSGLVLSPSSSLSYILCSCC